MNLQKVLSTKTKKERFKLNNETRRFFSKQSDKSWFQAYILYLELMSHNDGFKTSKTYIMNILGWKHTKTYTRALAILLDEGYVYRTGTNRNMVITSYEEPIGKEIRYKRKQIKIKSY